MFHDAQFGRRLTRTRQTALVLAGALACVFMAATAEVPAADTMRQDILHTVLARRLLLQDTQLAPYNLGVTVRNRAAVIWGTVPTAELARRAHDVVRAAPEFVEVR